MAPLLPYRCNILLDQHFTAKLGDFGVSRELPASTHGYTMVTAASVVKSLGYSPPEADTCRYSTKSDMYSYGVVSFAHAIDDLAPVLYECTHAHMVSNKTPACIVFGILCLSVSRPVGGRKPFSGACWWFGLHWSRNFLDGWI